jgi:peptidoglycan/xylan/chitin deacetylase (PgdA/CDA1 family)
VGIAAPPNICEMKKFLLQCFFFAITYFAQIKTFYSNGSESDGKVVLIFDDGLDKATRKISEMLKEKNTKASFLCSA